MLTDLSTGDVRVCGVRWALLAARHSVRLSTVSIASSLRYLCLQPLHKPPAPTLHPLSPLHLLLHLQAPPQNLPCRCPHFARRNARVSSTACTGTIAITSRFSKTSSATMTTRKCPQNDWFYEINFSHTNLVFSFIFEIKNWVSALIMIDLHINVEDS